MERRLPGSDDLGATARAADDRMFADASPTKPRKLDGAFSAALYVLSGFICGAVFWHFIGFWSTFHDILVRGPARAAAAQHHVAQWGPSCTALVLDRAQGLTRAEPCAASSIELAEATNYRRDRMPYHAAALRQPAIDTDWTVTIKDKPPADTNVVEADPEGPSIRPEAIAPH